MQQRSEETRTRIMGSALKLFAKSGYDATGVAEICTAAGVSKGAFYYHFTSKHDLFMTLLKDWLGNLDIAMQEARLSSVNVREGLVGMAAMTRTIFQDGQGLLPMFLEFWTQASRDPSVLQSTIAPYQQYQNFFANYVKEGMRDGSLRPVNPETAAKVIVALAIGMVLQGLLDPQGAAWDVITQDGIDLLMQGLATPNRTGDQI